MGRCPSMHYLAAHAASSAAAGAPEEAPETPVSQPEGVWVQATVTWLFPAQPSLQPRIPAIWLPEDPPVHRRADGALRSQP